MSFLAVMNQLPPPADHQYAHFHSLSLERSARVVERAGLAGGVLESDDLCIVTDDNDATPSATLGGDRYRLALLYPPHRCRPGLRYDSAKNQDCPEMENDRIGFDDARDAISVQCLDFHHFLSRNCHAVRPRVVTGGLVDSLVNKSSSSPLGLNHAVGLSGGLEDSWRHCFVAATGFPSKSAAPLILYRRYRQELKLSHFLSLVNRNPRICGMCLGLVAFLMMAPFVYFAKSNVQFLLDGQIVEARIVAQPAAVRSRFSTTYRYPVEYRDINGTHHLGRAFIRDANHKNGDIILMRYLRSDPARSRSETDIQNSWPVLVLALIAFVILASSLHAGFTGFRDILKQIRPSSMSV